MREQVLKINGGHRLEGGKVSIAGSSNQVTKCIIASLLTQEHVVIKSAPAVNERKIAEELFAYLGGQVEYLDENTIRLCAKDISKDSISREICQKKSHFDSGAGASFAPIWKGPHLCCFRRRQDRQKTGGLSYQRPPRDGSPC